VKKTLHRYKLAPGAGGRSGIFSVPEYWLFFKAEKTRFWEKFDF